jgi:hypothetical protein
MGRYIYKYEEEWWNVDRMFYRQDMHETLLKAATATTDGRKAWHTLPRVH